MIGALAAAAIRAAVRCLPADLRDRFGDAVMQDAARMVARAAARGAGAGVVMVLRVVTDVLRTARRERRAAALPATARFFAAGAGLAADCRDALRHLRRHPVHSASVVLTLSLAMGGVAAVFSVADPLLFRPLPYSNPDRLVRIDAISGNGLPMFHADFLRLAEAPVSFTALATGFAGPAFLGTLTEDADPSSPVMVSAVPPGFLDSLLGVTPALGRGFVPAEHAAGEPSVAIITDRTWRDAFERSADVLGQTLRLHGQHGGRFTVIGVLPPDFIFPDVVHTPPGAVVPGPAPRQEPPDPYHLATPLARLADGVTIAQAEDEIQRAFDGVAREYGGPFAVTRRPVLLPLREALATSMHRPLMMLLGVTMLVLVLAFLNVSHLVRSRLAGRERELATRAALGASRWRMARLLVVETGALAVLGLAGAILVGRSAAAGIMGALPQDGFSFRSWANALRAADVGLDVRVLAAVAGLALAGFAVFGLGPALIAARAKVAAPAPPSGHIRSARMGTKALLFAQSATAIAVLVAALLMVTDFTRLVWTDLGFEPDGVQTASITLSRGTDLDPARVRGTGLVLRDEIGRMTRNPVALVTSLPGVSLPMRLGRDGWIDEERLTSLAFPVSSEFQDVFGLRLRAGRWMTTEEGLEDRAVVVVDERVAALLWPGDTPLGKLARDSGGRVREVIGVVAHVKTRLIGHRFDGGVAFVPLPTTDVWPLTAAWRGELPPQARAHLAREVARVDPRAGVLLREVRFTRDQLGQPRFLAILLGTLGAVAVALTFVGLYGVVSDATVRRTREVGIRLALGARSREIAALVIAQCLRPAVLGVSLGLALALWWAEAVRSLLHGIGPHDWRVFTAATAATVAVVAFAAWLPARRAARLDPAMALRAD